MKIIDYMSKKSKQILKLEFASYVFCLIFGTISHFFFKWSGNSLFLASFVPISESVWEHGKLVFFPFFFFAIFESFFLFKEKNFLYAKTFSLVFCIPLMLVIYFTYTGILGKNYLPLDILTAFIVLTWENVSSYKKLTSEKTYKSSKILIFLTIVILVMFIIFTFVPPNFGMFLSP